MNRQQLLDYIDNNFNQSDYASIVDLLASKKEIIQSVKSELIINVDNSKRLQDVSEIQSSDFFAHLQTRARELRQQNLEG